MEWQYYGLGISTLCMIFSVFKTSFSFHHFSWFLDQWNLQNWTFLPICYWFQNHFTLVWDPNWQNNWMKLNDHFHSYTNNFGFWFSWICFGIRNFNNFIKNKTKNILWSHLFQRCSHNVQHTNKSEKWSHIGIKE